jgi:DNA-directed RNA polymerase specialized sigma24 family protein
MTTTVDTLTGARAYVAAYAEPVEDAQTHEEALAALARLESAARKAYERVAVDLVVTHGWSYAQLARSAGVTRQAAVKRFGPAVSEKRRRNPPAPAPVDGSKRRRARTGTQPTRPAPPRPQGSTRGR